MSKDPSFYTKSLLDLLDGTFKSENKDDLIEHCINNGADVNIMAEDTGATPLTTAIRLNHSNFVISSLLEAGANPNNGGDYYPAPIYIAAKYGSVSTVKLLLSSGAQINGNSYYDKSALFGAFEGNNIDTIKCLISKGALVDKSCIISILDFSKLDIEKFNQPIDQENNTLFMWIAEGYNINKLKEVLTTNPSELPKVKVNLTNNNGQKLIDFYTARLAKGEGTLEHLEMINFLRHIGSEEPNDPFIFSQNQKLDISSTHNVKNAAAVKTIQSKLKNKIESKYGVLKEDAYYSIFNAIEMYITLAGERLEKLLKEAENIDGIMKNVRDHLNSTKSELKLESQDHNQWNFRQELAHVFLELHEQNDFTTKFNIDSLVQVLSLKNSCPIGKLVNLYKLIENINADSKQPMFTIETNTLANRTMELLNKLNLENDKKKEIIKKFYNEITCQLKGEHSEHANSLEVQLANSLFYDSFIEQAKANSIDGPAINCLDHTKIKETIKDLVFNYSPGHCNDNALYQCLGDITLNEDM
jgi:hypothetical protein